MPIITALRYAEEVREEAGGLQQNLPEVMILASIGNIYYRLGQYEEAVLYTVESTEKALQNRDPNSTIYAANYDFLSAMSRYMNRWQELDKAEKEIERRQAAIQRQRMFITVLSVVCLALTLVVVLVILNRRRIAEKNRGLYRQIKEQDRIVEALAKTM